MGWESTLLYIVPWVWFPALSPLKPTPHTFPSPTQGVRTVGAPNSPTPLSFQDTPFDDSDDDDDDDKNKKGNINASFKTCWFLLIITNSLIKATSLLCKYSLSQVP